MIANRPSRCVFSANRVFVTRARDHSRYHGGISHSSAFVQISRLSSTRCFLLFTICSYEKWRLDRNPLCIWGRHSSATSLIRIEINLIAPPICIRGILKDFSDRSSYVQTLESTNGRNCRFFFLSLGSLTINSRLRGSSRGSIKSLSRRSRHWNRTVLRSDPVYPTRLASCEYIARYLKYNPGNSVFGKIYFRRWHPSVQRAWPITTIHRDIEFDDKTGGYQTRIIRMETSTIALHDSRKKPAPFRISLLFALSSFHIFTAFTLRIPINIKIFQISRGGGGGENFPNIIYFYKVVMVKKN